MPFFRLLDAAEYATGLRTRLRTATTRATQVVLHQGKVRADLAIEVVCGPRRAEQRDDSQDEAAHLRLAEQELVHESRQTTPPLRLLRERPLSGFGDGVVLRVAIVLGFLPDALD